jgi:hypothetical protein
MKEFMEGEGVYNAAAHTVTSFRQKHSHSILLVTAATQELCALLSTSECVRELWAKTKPKEFSELGREGQILSNYFVRMAVCKIVRRLKDGVDALDPEDGGDELEGNPSACQVIREVMSTMFSEHGFSPLDSKCSLGYGERFYLCNGGGLDVLEKSLPMGNLLQSDMRLSSPRQNSTSSSRTIYSS